MPYKSKAQQRYFHAAESRGEISHAMVKEYDRATKGEYGSLSQHAHNERIAMKDAADFGNAHAGGSKSPAKKTGKLARMARSSEKGTIGPTSKVGRIHSGGGSVGGKRSRIAHGAGGHAPLADAKRSGGADVTGGDVFPRNRGSGSAASSGLGQEYDLSHDPPPAAAIHANPHAGFTPLRMMNQNVVPMYLAQSPASGDHTGGDLGVPPGYPKITSGRVPKKLGKRARKS